MAVGDYVVFISETTQLLVATQVSITILYHRALFLKVWHPGHVQLTHQTYLVKMRGSHTYKFANGHPWIVHLTYASVRPVNVCNEAEVLPR